MKKKLILLLILVTLVGCHTFSRESVRRENDDIRNLKWVENGNVEKMWCMDSSDFTMLLKEAGRGRSVIKVRQ